MCECLCGHAGWRGVSHFSKRYHLPNLRLTLINLCLCNLKPPETCFVSPLKHAPLPLMLLVLCDRRFCVYVGTVASFTRSHIIKNRFHSQATNNRDLFSCCFPSRQNIYASTGPQMTNISVNVSFLFCFNFLLFILKGNVYIPS